MREELHALEEAPDGRRSTLPGTEDSEIVQRVVRLMVESFSSRLGRAEADAERQRGHAAPLIQAAFRQRSMTQRELARLFEVSDSSISALRSHGKPSKLREIQLEAALHHAARSWTAARTRAEILRAHRRRWLGLGARVGVPVADLAEDAGLSRSAVEKALRRDPAREARERALLTSDDVQALTGGEPETDAEWLATLAVLEHVADTHPEDPSVLYAIGWFLQHHGRDGGALEYYRRAAEHDSACAAHNLGMAALRAEDHPTAERWFRRAEELAHMCPRARALGDHLAATGRPEEARDAWRAAATRGVAAAAQALAEHLHAADEHDEEWHWVRYAADRDDPIALRRVAYAQWEAGETDASLETYFRAAAHGDAEAACWVGRQLAKVGDRRAQRFLEQASAAGHIDATEELITFLTLTNPARALAACRRLRELGGEVPLAIYAELLSDVDGSPEALTEARELWRLSANQAEDDRPYATLRAAMLSRRLGDHEAAEEGLWNALADGSHDVAIPAAIELAELRRRPGVSQEDAMHEVVEEAFELGLHRAAAALADIYVGLDRTAEALEVLRRARRLERDRTTLAELEADQVWIAVWQTDELTDELFEECMRRWKTCHRRGSIKALTYLGSVYSEATEQSRAAEGVFRELIALGYPYHRELAKALETQGRIDEAIAALDAGIRENEDDCWAPRGRLAHDAGDEDAAMDYWRSGAAAEDWKASCLLGLALDRRGDTKQAKAVLQRAADRRSSCAMNLIGTIDYRTNRQRGITSFRRAWKATCFHGAYNLAVALGSSSSSSALLERRQALEFVLEARPDDLEAAILLAEATAGLPSPTILPIVYQAGYSDERAAEVIRLLDPDHLLGEPPTATRTSGSLRRLTRRFRPRSAISEG